jgi:hypothetical protein
VPVHPTFWRSILMKMEGQAPKMSYTQYLWVHVTLAEVHKDIKPADSLQYNGDVMQCYQMKSCRASVWKLSLGDDPSLKGNSRRTQRCVSVV